MTEQAGAERKWTHIIRGIGVCETTGHAEYLARWRSPDGRGFCDDCMEAQANALESRLIEDELADLRRKLADAERERDFHKREQYQHEEMLTEIMGKVGAQTDHLFDRLNALLAAEQSLASEQQMHSERYGALAGEIAKYKALESELADLRRKLAEAERELAQAREERDAAIALYGDMGRKRDALHEEYVELAKLYDEKTDTAEAAESRAAALEGKAALATERREMHHVHARVEGCAVCIWNARYDALDAQSKQFKQDAKLNRSSSSSG